MSHENRTLAPTARRRQQARREGNAPASRQVTAAAITTVLAIMLGCGSGQGLATMKAVFREAWAVPLSQGPGGDMALVGIENAVCLAASRLVLPLVSMVAIVAVLSRLMQVGFVWAPQRIVPRGSRIDPGHRLAELLSVAHLRDTLGVSVMALGSFLGVGWGIWRERHTLAAIVGADDVEAHLLLTISHWSLKIGIGVALVAMWDYFCKRVQFERQLRMSPEELRAEIRAIEGNPEVARAHRERRRWQWTKMTKERSEHGP